MLVDVPGYGFAAAGKAQVDAWHKLINQFLIGMQQYVLAGLFFVEAGWTSV